MNRIVVALVTSLLAGNASVDAQGFTAQECSQITANALSNPARLDTLAMVGSCPGAFGPTFAALLTNPVVYSDTTAFDAVQFWAGRRTEPEIFNAAISIAGDPGAQTLARLMGLAILIRYVRGNSPEYQLRHFPASYADVEGCIVTSGGTSISGEQSLPANKRVVAEGVALTVMGSSAADPVRYLAHCLYYVSTDSFPAVQGPPPPPNDQFIPSQNFQVEVLCGRRVLLRNTSRVPVSIRLVWGDTSYQVTQNYLARDYTLPGRSPGAATFEVIWTVPSSTATKFRVQQVTNTYGGPPYILLLNMESLNTSACQ